MLDHLDEPSSIIVAPGNTLYLSVLGKIIRFDPATRIVQDIVINLPSEGRHPLSALVAAPDGSLFINVGSATDHCEKPDDSAPDPDVPCPETTASTLPRGSLLHVMSAVAPIDAQTIPPYAIGLRNSMALAVSASGQLYAAVNARDAIDQADPALSDEELPHDTFDKIEQGRDYGWPYCYDDNRPSPEYPQYDCSKKQPPTMLLPAHAAPLGMLFYQGKSLPGLEGQLMIGYHGYRAKGHRLVTLQLDEAGLPKAPPVEIVNGWDAQPGNHPQGAPVGLFKLDDGSILIAEDQNGTLLRLARQ
jgi:glucose/arabinose dehydrogenase